MNNLIPNLKFKGECIDNPRALFSRPEELIYCGASYSTRDQQIKSTVLSRGFWVDAKKTGSYFHNFWIITPDTLMKAQVEVRKQGRGSRLKLVISSELPGQGNPLAVDILVEISKIPERIEQVLLNAKSNIESNSETDRF